MACLACAGIACAAVLLPLFGHGEPVSLGTLLGGGLGGKVRQAGIEGKGGGAEAPPSEGT